MRRKIRDAESDRYAALKQMLQDRRQEIQEKLRTLRETFPAETQDVRDPEEQSVDDFVQDVDFALMQMKSETLRRIDEAVHRLEDGSYGACGECGIDIPAARLRALPFAELCRDCQQARETSQAEAQENGHRGERVLEHALR
jgi:DnaK suppressor protein